jgi:hypothetical protein
LDELHSYNSLIHWYVCTLHAYVTSLTLACSKKWIKCTLISTSRNCLLNRMSPPPRQQKLELWTPKKLEGRLRQAWGYMVVIWNLWLTFPVAAIKLFQNIIYQFTSLHVIIYQFTSLLIQRNFKCSQLTRVYSMTYARKRIVHD